MSPLEYYMTALEEIVNHAWRDATTRSGMFCERVVNILLSSVDTPKKNEPMKVESTMMEELFLDEKSEKSKKERELRFRDKVGRLQNFLEARKYQSAENLWYQLQVIYNLRDQRGPHDVPAAEEIDSKLCIGACPFIYAKYAEVVELYAPGAALQMGEFVKIVNSVLEVSAKLNLGPGGRQLGTRDSIEELLYKEDFFLIPKTFEEVKKALADRGYFPLKGTLHNTLDDCSGKGGFLTKDITKKPFTYVQKLPPIEYYLLKSKV
jgi:hypothetical protein